MSTEKLLTLRFVEISTFPLFPNTIAHQGLNVSFADPSAACLGNTFAYFLERKKKLLE